MTHLDEARRLLVNGQSAESDAEFEKAHAAHELDGDSSAWSDWGAALYDLGRYGGAHEKLGEALRLNANNPDALVNLGAVLAAEGQYRYAIERYAKADKIRPNDAITHHNWGNSLRKSGDAAAAISHYQQALAIKPDYGEALEALSTAYFSMRDYTHAIEALDKGIELAPDNKHRWSYKLDQLASAPDAAMARTAIEGALAKFPDDVDMLIKAGNLYAAHWEYDKALDLYQHAFTLNLKTSDLAARNEQTATISYRMGLAYFNSHRTEQAYESFDMALTADPERTDALQLKIASLRERRRLDEAEALLAPYLGPGAPHAADTLLLMERAALHLQRTEYDKAIEAYRMVLMEDATDQDALAGILSACRQRRDFGAAEQFWKEEIVAKNVQQGDTLFSERCQLLMDRNQFAEGLAYCAQRPDTDLNALEWKLIFLRGKRDFKAAELEARAALKRWPGNLTFLRQLGVNYFAQRQFGKAEELFQKIIDGHPGNEDAQYLKVLALYNEGPYRSDAAEQEALAGLKQAPNSALLYGLLGQICAERDEVKAETYLAKAMSLASFDNVVPDLLRVEVLERLKRSDEARDLICGLMEKRPNDVMVRNQFAWFHLGRNQPLKARQEYDAVLEIDRVNAEATNGLGGVYFAEGNYEQAEQMFRRALELNPYEPAVLSNLAWALVRRAGELDSPARKERGEGVTGLLKKKRPRDEDDDADEFTEAEKLCKQAAKLDPRYAQAYTCLGTIAFKRGRILESEDYLLASLRASAKNGGYVDLGALYVHMGKYEDAETYLKKAAEINRADSRARIELGNLYLLTGREKEGVRLFREALDIDPGSPDPPRALALALQAQGNFIEAEQALRKAIRKLDRGRTWQLHVTLAQLLTEMGDKSEDIAFYEEALKQIKKAVPLKQNNPEIYFRYGIIKYRLEDYKGAAKRFSECLALDPDYIEAERNLRIVRTMVREQLRRARSVFWLGIVLGTFCLAGTVALWWLYFHTADKITAKMVGGLTPTLIAIAAAAFLFPYLVRLKLPGVEAELSQPAEKISKGPVGSPAGDRGGGGGAGGLSRA